MSRVNQASSPPPRPKHPPSDTVRRGPMNHHQQPSHESVADTRDILPNELRPQILLEPSTAVPGNGTGVVGRSWCFGFGQASSQLSTLFKFADFFFQSPHH